MMDIHQILKQLPHRYPFLLVDRVVALEKGRSIRTLKNVTIGAQDPALFELPADYVAMPSFGGKKGSGLGGAAKGLLGR